LRNLTFDDLGDKFLADMHTLLQKDESGVIATEERRQSMQERAGNMRMQRTASHTNRGDDSEGRGGRTVGGGRVRMWGDEQLHAPGRGGRGVGRGDGHGRQPSGTRKDHWGRRPMGGYNQSASRNERSGGGTGTFSEWSQNKKPAPPPPGGEMLRAEDAYRFPSPFSVVPMSDSYANKTAKVLKGSRRVAFVHLFTHLMQFFADSPFQYCHPV
jgi:hypothetical protein